MLWLTLTKSHQKKKRRESFISRPEIQEIWWISIPSSRSGSRHQTSSWVRGASQSTHLQSWCWAFSNYANTHIKTVIVHENLELTKLYRTELCIRTNLLTGVLTLISWTSIISFSSRSDTLRDFCSASFSSTNYRKKETTKLAEKTLV